LFSGTNVDASEILIIVLFRSYLKARNTYRWVVWVGRHPSENITEGHKGLLR